MQKTADTQGIIFDLDGTLYPLQGFKRRIILRNLKNLLILKNMIDARKALSGKDFGDRESFYKELFFSIAENTKTHEEKIRKWYFNTFYPAFIRLLKEKYGPRKYLLDVLSYLKKYKIPVAVLSDYAFVPERLNALGIENDFFKIIASNEEYGALKPAPRPLRAIAEEMNIPPEKTLVIGDREDMDGVSARSAGMKFIKITKDLNREEFLRLLAIE